jgi:hypothetical protein
MKKCFNTKNNLPLFLFKKDSSKYQIQADKGRCKVCRICDLKKSLKQGGYSQGLKENTSLKN